MWRTLKTAHESEGSQGSGAPPTSRYSAGQGPAATKALTPSAYASSMARVSALAAATSARALAASRNRRICTSCASAAGPAYSAQRPYARRRS